MEIEISYNRFKNKVHIIKEGYATYCGLSTGSPPAKCDATLFLKQQSDEICKTCRKAVNKILN